MLCFVVGAVALVRVLKILLSEARDPTTMSGNVTTVLIYVRSYIRSFLYTLVIM